MNEPLSQSERGMISTRLTILIANSTTSGVAGVLLGIAITVMLRDSELFPYMVGWVLSMMVVYAFRHVISYKRILSDISSPNFDFQKAYKIVKAYVLISGLFWGVSSYFFLPHPEQSEQLITYFVIIVGIISGNVPSLAVSKQAYYMLMIPALVGPLIWGLEQGWWIFSFGVIAYGGYCAVLTASLSQKINAAIKTDSDNEKLVVELQKAQQQSENDKEKIAALLNKKNQFLANITHEFKTPLTLILGPLEELKSQFKGKDNGSLELIRSNALRLLRLVEQLLSLARLESADQTQKRSQFCHFSELLGEVITQLTPLMAQKSITLTHAIPSGVVAAMAPGDAELILSNLLTNAIKYNKEGGSIHIELKNLHKRVYLAISDTGIGIPQHDHKQVFDRFARGSNVSQDSTMGTGVGLAIVKEVVTLYEGAIDLSSRPGKGTQIKISLPEASVENVKTDSAKPSVETLSHEYFDVRSETVLDDSISPEENQPTTEKPTLLIVEDNVDLRAFLNRQLSVHFSCIEADNGDDGFRLAESCIPDLIITDLMMPIMDGIFLSRKIRETEATQHIPVLMLTANVDAIEKPEAWQSDIDECLPKPFEPQELLLCCKNLISMNKRQPETS